MLRNMKVLIIGCGYVGTRLGKELVRRGHQVAGVRRTAAPELPGLGIEPVIADLTIAQEWQALLSGFDVVVNTASSSRGGAFEYRQVYLEGNRRMVGALRESPPRRYLAVGSTSVYAQADGSWVNESSPVHPKSETGKILVETEQLLLQSGLPVCIFRSAGIYGPERGHLFRQFLAGTARLHGAGDRWLNMIHVDDLAQMLATAAESESLPAVCNAVDEEPVTERGFFSWLSEQLGRPLPPSASPEEFAGRKRGVTSKRVSNGLVKQALGFTYQFPTFREGYAAEIQRVQSQRV